MRLSIKILFLFIIVVSCKKTEKPRPDQIQTTVNTSNTNPIGISWELYSGQVYVKNTDLNTYAYYDHFGLNKNSSNVDIYSPSWLPIDIITKGMTTWKYTSSNQFILDGSSTYNYNINTNGFFNVYGLENGSARNVEVISSTPDYLNVKMNTIVGNDGTYNYSYYSVLNFVRQGFTGTPQLPSVPYGYIYGGVYGGTVTVQPSIVGTKWKVTKYIQNLVPTYPNDTIEFVSTTQYKFNSSITLRNYSLSGIVGNNMKSLSLYSFTTLGGDWSGQVQATFINDWIINNAQFTDLFTVAPNTAVWMLRIL